MSRFSLARLFHRSPPTKVLDATFPEQLGDYRILEKLGEGGVGAVYRALHVKLDRVVALKTLGARFLGDQRAMARFEREMRAVGQLDHPNVVRAHDAREFDGVPMLVMEYVDGMDLGRVVQQCGPLPIPSACEAIRQAALGLHAAHQLKLVHRDIKPSNLILNVQGVIKILDLGLARFQSDQPEDKELTGTEQTMGTADYIAPEQVHNTHEADIRSDIYALGCTFYKLLTGHVPFSGPEYRTALQKMLAHVNKAVPPVAASRPDVPQAVATIVARMTARSPAGRFATPAELVKALTPHCAGAKLPGLLVTARELASSSLLNAPAQVATDGYVSSELLGTQAGQDVQDEGPSPAGAGADPMADPAADRGDALSNLPDSSPPFPWRRMLLTALAVCLVTLLLGWLLQSKSPIDENSAGQTPAVEAGSQR